MQNRCYMCIHSTRVLYSVVITQQSNTTISQFNSLCNEFTSFWSMFVYNTIGQCFVYACGATTVGQCFVYACDAISPIQCDLLIKLTNGIIQSNHKSMVELKTVVTSIYFIYSYNSFPFNAHSDILDKSFDLQESTLVLRTMNEWHADAFVLYHLSTISNVCSQYCQPPISIHNKQNSFLCQQEKLGQTIRV